MQDHFSSSPSQSTSFLLPIDITICLYTSSILMPVSIFVLINTINQISFDQIHEVVTLYVLGVKISTAFVGIISSIVAHITAIFHPQKLTSWVLMILGILASFGAMMSISTIFFKSNWSNHIEAMRHVMFLVAEVVLMSTSMILSIKLALRFKSQIECARTNNSTIPTNYIRISSILLASLLILGSLTSFVGFMLGVYVNTQLLRENTITGGGLYSGFLGILTSIIFVIALKMCSRKIQKISMLLILILGILTIISAATSYFTEELELLATIEYIGKNQPIFQDYISYKILLLSKSTLVELSSLFITIFTCPLLVSAYSIIVQLQQMTTNSTHNFRSNYSNNTADNIDEIPFNSIQSSNHVDLNNMKCCHNNKLFDKQQINIDSIELSAITHTTSGIEGD